MPLRRPTLLRLCLGLFLALALAGVTAGACAGERLACDCCPPAPGGLTFNADQAPALQPFSAPSVPPAALFLAGLLAFAAVRFAGPVPALAPAVSFRSDPGRRRPNRALLRTWTL
ncbi:MAG TPA: hypothetical protein VIM58_07815 [Candidatus Methylacidiphilales bacterium]